MSVIRNGRKAKITMKKKILLASVIATCCLGAFLMSCSKDEDNSSKKKSCTCTESDGEGYSASREIDPASFGATSCADLELKLRVAAPDQDFSYSCR
jgi:hypothetical protein